MRRLSQSDKLILGSLLIRQAVGTAKGTVFGCGRHTGIVQHGGMFWTSQNFLWDETYFDKRQDYCFKFCFALLCKYNFQGLLFNGIITMFPLSFFIIFLLSRILPQSKPFSTTMFWHTTVWYEVRIMPLVLCC